MTFVPSTESQTVALPATGSVFVAETVIVDALPASAGVTAMLAYVRTGSDATSAYQPRATPPYGAVATTSASCAPNAVAATVNVASPVAFVTNCWLPIQTFAPANVPPVSELYTVTVAVVVPPAETRSLLTETFRNAVDVGRYR